MAYHDRHRTDDPPASFIIAGPMDAEDGRLYWSNEDGWGFRATATVFHAHERDHLDPQGTTGYEEVTMPFDSVDKPRDEDYPQGSDTSHARRYAVVYGIKGDTLERYLPGNYRILSMHAADPNGGTNYVIHGRDYAGWTLAGYVVPRLGSGGYRCTMYKDHVSAVDAAAGAMN